MTAKEIIAARAAKELENGDIVNLGIGLPTMIPQFLPPDVEVTIHAELGIVGAGGRPDEEHENYAPYHVTDAGGHVDACILGALEVDEEGSLANWIIPGKKMPGMGGAMDLCVGAKKCIVAMEHTAKGRPKILKKCTLPYTAVKCVDMIITEMGVIQVTPDGLELAEINPAYTVEDVQKATEAELKISPTLKPMCT